jgi:hypothetical protein
MPNARNALRKLYICYKRAPTHPTQEIKHTQSYLSFLYIVSQKMIPHFNVFGFGMEYWVLGNTYGTGAITSKWDMGILLTKVTHGV